MFCGQVWIFPFSNGYTEPVPRKISMITIIANMTDIAWRVLLLSVIHTLLIRPFHAIPNPRSKVATALHSYSVRHLLYYISGDSTNIIRQSV